MLMSVVGSFQVGPRVQSAGFTALSNLWCRTQTSWWSPCFLYQRRLHCHSKRWRHCPERTSVAASLRNISTRPTSVQWNKLDFGIRRQQMQTNKNQSYLFPDNTFLTISIQDSYYIMHLMNTLCIMNGWCKYCCTLACNNVLLLFSPKFESFKVETDNSNDAQLIPSRPLSTIRKGIGGIRPILSLNIPYILLLDVALYGHVRITWPYNPCFHSNDGNVIDQSGRYVTSRQKLIFGVQRFGLGI